MSFKSLRARPALLFLDGQLRPVLSFIRSPYDNNARPIPRVILSPRGPLFFLHLFKEGFIQNFVLLSAVMSHASSEAPISPSYQVIPS